MKKEVFRSYYLTKEQLVNTLSCYKVNIGAICSFCSKEFTTEEIQKNIKDFRIKLIEKEDTFIFVPWRHLKTHF